MPLACYLLQDVQDEQALPLGKCRVYSCAVRLVPEEESLSFAKMREWLQLADIALAEELDKAA